MVNGTVLSRKIPTLLGLLFLGGGLAVGMYVVQRGGGFFPKASPETTPKHVKITNITDKSFSVSFITDEPTLGWVKFGDTPNNVKDRIADERDQVTGTAGQYVTHHITLTGLTANTNYYFVLGTSAPYDNDGKPFVQKTGPPLQAAEESITAYGTVVTNASTPAKDSLIYITPEGGAPLSAYTKSSGSWSITLHNARTADNASLMKIDDTTPLSVFVQGKDDTTTGIISVAEAKQSPAFTLGTPIGGDMEGTGMDEGVSGTETADGGTEPLAGTTSTDITTEDTTTAEDVSTDTANTTDTFTPDTSTSDTTDTATADTTYTDTYSYDTYIDTSSTLDAEGQIMVTEINIDYDADGTVVNTTKPLITGSAPANTTVKVKIQSDPVYNGTATADSFGNWDFTPPGDLAPGDHTLTVTYTDPETGEVVTEERSFVVDPDSTLAQADVGNPEIGGAEADLLAQTSQYDTKLPSYSATPSGRTTVPATGSGQPVSGSVEQTYGLLGMGILFIAAGGYLYIKTKQQEACQTVRNMSTLE